jgi:mono/diheme cytochrome c family protein
MCSKLVLCAAMLLVPAWASAQGASAAEGQKVYEAQKCSVCHSIGGQGNKNGVLDDVGSKLSADDIRQWIVNAAEMTTKTKATRKPPMKSYAQLPKGEVDALVAYMQSLKKK